MIFIKVLFKQADQVVALFTCTKQAWLSSYALVTICEITAWLAALSTDVFLREIWHAALCQSDDQQPEAESSH